MKLIKNTKEKLVFSAEINESLANAIRRSVLEIPVLAIDEVEFHENDSALFDEIIAHRMGLIPLKMDKTFTEHEKCSCKGKGCGKCTVTLKLKAIGPKTVYSGELKGSIKPVFEKIPITILQDEQELQLVAKVKLGKGIEHAKFSPGLVYYRNLALCENCAKKYSEKVLKRESKTLTLDIYKCDSCGANIQAGKKNLGTFAGKELILFIESWGQLEPKKILVKAIGVLKNNLKELGKSVVK